MSQPSPAPRARQLFVLVATGSAVSNVPPVLAIAEQGDYVLWLCTTKAEAEQWHKQPSEVLGSRGLRVLPDRIKLGDAADIFEARNALRRILSGLNEEGRGLRVVLVINGGSKPLSIGLFSALRDLADNPPAILYGEAPRARLWKYDDIDRIPGVRIQVPAERRITLAEALQCNGYTALSGSEVIWPTRSAPRREVSKESGARFENAVAAEVLKLLRANTDVQKAVAEVVVRQKITPANSSAIAGELDVAVVMINGVIVSFEAKSDYNRAKRMDILAKAGRLHEAVGALAAQIVCLPVPGGSVPAGFWAVVRNLTIDNEQDVILFPSSGKSDFSVPEDSGLSALAAPPQVRLTKLLTQKFI